MGSPLPRYQNLYRKLEVVVLSLTNLSYKRPFAVGLAFAGLTLIVYLAVVVATTPNLPASDAINIAFRLNWWVILGVSTGSGAQAFLISSSKRQHCNFRLKKPLSGASGGVAVLSSFLSYLALVPVGCCGSWLYIISFLPGIVGTGASAFLIDYSRITAALGLVIMTLSILYTYFTMRGRLRTARLTGDDGAS
jgi:hypothetical protein